MRNYDIEIICYWDIMKLSYSYIEILGYKNIERVTVKISMHALLACIYQNFLKIKPSSYRLTLRIICLNWYIWILINWILNYIFEYWYIWYWYICILKYLNIDIFEYLYIWILINLNIDIFEYRYIWKLIYLNMEMLE